jgi:hypothetical protein
VAEHQADIKGLLIERMTWAMLSDLSELEAILGAGGNLVGGKAENLKGQSYGFINNS